MANVKTVATHTTKIATEKIKAKPQIATNKTTAQTGGIFLHKFSACTNRLNIISMPLSPYIGSLSVILGIGIDLVECDRFLDWSAFKKQRIFTKKELEYAENDNANSEKHLANFWAAREAFLKALGTGFGEDISFSDVSVVHNDAGRPELLITGGAKLALKERANGDANIHLSITDQSGYCAAMVIIETV